MTAPGLELPAWDRVRQEVSVLVHDIVMDPLQIRDDELRGLIGLQESVVGAFHDVGDDLVVR